mmetsp:Transcript_26185/g.39644  ORF Transcript_26185/g.39644 Transcript_26185/m.39644 type:complete len:252 (-) Transcript_26185:17-772(-)
MKSSNLMNTMIPMKIILFCVVLTQLFAPGIKGNRVLEISLANSTSEEKYVAQVATFGYQFPDAKQVPLEANLLLLTAEDKYLCEVPQFKVELNDASEENEHAPIALLVSRGRCDFQTKALVALRTRQRYSNRLKYIIVYNDQLNHRQDKKPVVMDAPKGFEDENPGIGSIGFVFVSLRCGNDLKLEIAKAETPDYTFLFEGDLSDAGEFPILLAHATSIYPWMSSARTNIFAHDVKLVILLSLMMVIVLMI